MNFTKAISVSILSFILLATSQQILANEFSELTYQYPVHRLTLNDSLHVAYIDEGKGNETLILIHGLGSYIPAWRKNMPTLSETYRCVALDLPGYGKSSKADYPIGMEFYSDIIAQLMDHLEIKTATLIGHSMGGQIAMTAALAHPEKIAQLILIAPAGLEAFSAAEATWFKQVMTVEAIMATPDDQVKANLAANFHNFPESAAFMITDRLTMKQSTEFEKYCLTVVKSIHAMLEEPVLPRLDQIAQPTLIIFGEKDMLIPNPLLHANQTVADIARVGTESIPGSRLELISSAGHFVMFEAAEQVNDVILRFMQ